MNFINVFLGFIIGSIVGLIGLHINDILPITFYLGFEFIISSTISWYFFSLIPSILLRIPENTNYIILNKLNRDVLNGNGLKILENTVFNCFLITILSLFGLFLYLFFINNNQSIVKIVLIFVIISFLRSFKHLFILILCFSLGYITFNTGLELLFPILSGLFAIPVYLTSEKFNSVDQKENNNIEIKKEIVPSLIISSFFSSFPALSSSISAIFSKKLFKKLDIVYLMIFSEYIYLIFSLLYYEKVRSATSYYLNLFNFDFVQLFLIILFSASFSCFLILKFSKKFNKLTKLYKPRLFLFFVILLTFYIYGFYGFLVLLAASTIGLLCNFWKIERTLLISTLIFPVLFI